MDIPGLATPQAPARAELRQGASSAAPAAAPQPTRTDAPTAVREVSRTAESNSARKLQQGEDGGATTPGRLSFATDLFPGIQPEPIPAELSAAERSAAYAQLLGSEESPGADQRADAARKLFLTAQDLFSG